MQHRPLDDDLGRLEPAAAATRRARTPWKIPASRASGSPSGSDTVHILGPQIQLLRVAIDPEAHPGDRHLEADAGTLERRLDIGRQPVQLDRALHQAPDAEQQHQDDDRRQGADPAQHVMGAAADMPRRPAMQRGPSAAAGVSHRRGRRVPAGVRSRISPVSCGEAVIRHLRQ